MATYSGPSPTVIAPLAHAHSIQTGNFPRQLALGVVGLLLAFLAVTTLVACGFALVIPQQLDEGEPVVYGLAQRILDGQSLYQSADQVPAYYTPLYLYVIAALRRVHLVGFGPGRAVSLAAGLVAALLLAYLARKHSSSWWAGLIAVLMFLGLGFPMAPVPFLSLERVDLLGVAFSFSAIAILSRGANRTHVVVAGIAAGLALLTKQSLFAAAIAGTLWLITVQPRRAAEFAASTAATFLIPALIFQWSSGGYFWDNVGLANATVTSLANGYRLLKEFLVFQGILMVLAASYLVRTRAWANARPRLIGMYWLATFLPLGGLVKIGSNYNYWIELAGADAVLATLCIWTVLQRRDGALQAIAAWLPICLVGAELGFLVPPRLLDNRDFSVVPFTETLMFDRLTRLVSEAPDFQRLVVDVSGERGLVLSESMDVAVLGNHPLVIEPFDYRMAEQLGRWDSTALVHTICSGDVTLLALSYPIETENYPGAGFAWPRSVLTALRQSMVYEQVRAVHWLYRSKPNPDAETIAACESAAAADRSTSAS